MLYLKKLSKIYYSSSKKTKDLLNKTAKSLTRIAKKQVYVAGIAVKHIKDLKNITLKRYEKLKDTGIKIIRQIQKRLSGLDESYCRDFDGDRIWATLSVMALNIRKLLRDITKNPELILRFA